MTRGVYNAEGLCEVLLNMLFRLLFYLLKMKMPASIEFLLNSRLSGRHFTYIL